MLVLLRQKRNSHLGAKSWLYGGYLTFYKHFCSNFRVWRALSCLTLSCRRMKSSSNWQCASVGCNRAHKLHVLHLTVSKWQNQDHSSKCLAITFAVAQLRTYSTYPHNHCKITSTICLYSRIKILPKQKLLFTWRIVFHSFSMHIICYKNLSTY